MSAYAERRRRGGGEARRRKRDMLTRLKTPAKHLEKQKEE